MKKKLLKLSSIALLGLCLSLAPLNTFAEEKTIEEAVYNEACEALEKIGFNKEG